MKLLVATGDKQGQRDNDFNFATEGELLYFGMECDEEEVDGTCGCRRSMSGIDSHKGTTTMKLVEIDIEEPELHERVEASLHSAGWIFGEELDGVAADMVAEVTAEMIALGQSLPIGVVIERRGNTVQTR